ncbi:MAG: hypothetical protein LBV03_09505 [Fusobacteriales bacterium]|jgi:biopolymer transport protein ExbB/TolQ|nr:hypothetical protein [Fusobacteriales bacterium]
MKKIIFVILILGNFFAYAYEKLEKIENKIERLDRYEDNNFRKALTKKEQIENSVSKLKKNYNDRVAKTEELKEDSQINWYKKEYKKIYKKYNGIQKETLAAITEKEKELSGINKGLSIINKNAEKNIDKKAVKQ